MKREGNIPHTGLVLMEGIPGSGKSTLSARLHAALVQAGLPAVLYAEGDTVRSINLAWHAYLPSEDYAALLRKHPGISRHVIVTDMYALLRYRDANGPFFEDELHSLLADREFCYATKPAVPLETYTAIICDHWRRFVDATLHANELPILDASFFQHQIHDLMRLYSMNESQIIAHLERLLSVIEPLDPILFYITQKDVRESLTQTAARRSKPSFATEENIAFWSRRKQIEYAAMAKLPLRAHVLDNTNEQWDLLLPIMQSLLFLPPKAGHGRPEG